MSIAIRKTTAFALAAAATTIFMGFSFCNDDVRIPKAAASSASR